MMRNSTESGVVYGARDYKMSSEFGSFSWFDIFLEPDQRFWWVGSTFKMYLHEERCTKASKYLEDVKVISPEADVESKRI